MDGRGAGVEQMQEAEEIDGAEQAQAEDQISAPYLPDSEAFGPGSSVHNKTTSRLTHRLLYVLRQLVRLLDSHLTGKARPNEGGERSSDTPALGNVGLTCCNRTQCSSQLVNSCD